MDSENSSAVSEIKTVKMENVSVNFTCQFDWSWGAQIKRNFGCVCVDVSGPD